MSVDTKPTPSLKQLRAEAQRLGITAELAGCPIDELVKRAAETEDPSGYLTMFAPAPPAEDAMPVEPPPSALRPPPSALRPLTAFSLNDALIPLGEVPAEEVAAGRYYVGRHVEARLSPEQGVALRRLTLGLEQHGARTQTGKAERIVHTAADAIRWLLEQIR